MPSKTWICAISGMLIAVAAMWGDKKDYGYPIATTNQARALATSRTSRVSSGKYESTPLDR